MKVFQVFHVPGGVFSRLYRIYTYIYFLLTLFLLGTLGTVRKKRCGSKRNGVPG